MAEPWTDAQRAGLRRVTKVLAYVLDRGRLLVFTQPAAPEAGLQVPAGTVEDGERLAAAVLRELAEESGLRGLALPRYLGRRTVDMRPYGKPEVHRRHFFALRPLASPPESWRHWERHASDGQGPLAYDLFWHDLASGLPVLAADQGALLPGLDLAPTPD
jgi:8-oxo-dGTP pyrophosphatase MutT (NUDIX family)